MLLWRRHICFSPCHAISQCDNIPGETQVSMGPYNRSNWRLWLLQALLILDPLESFASVIFVVGRGLIHNYLYSRLRPGIYQVFPRLD